MCARVETGYRIWCGSGLLEGQDSDMPRPQNWLDAARGVAGFSRNPSEAANTATAPGTYQGGRRANGKWRATGKERGSLVTPQDDIVTAINRCLKFPPGLLPWCSEASQVPQQTSESLAELIPACTTARRCYQSYPGLNFWSFSRLSLRHAGQTSTMAARYWYDDCDEIDDESFGLQRLEKIIRRNIDNKRGPSRVLTQREVFIDSFRRDDRSPWYIRPRLPARSDELPEVSYPTYSEALLRNEGRWAHRLAVETQPHGDAGRGQRSPPLRSSPAPFWSFSPSSLRYAGPTSMVSPKNRLRTHHDAYMPRPSKSRFRQEVTESLQRTQEDSKLLEDALESIASYNARLNELAQNIVRLEGNPNNGPWKSVLDTLFNYYRIPASVANSNLTGVHDHVPGCGGGSVEEALNGLNALFEVGLQYQRMGQGDSNRRGRDSLEDVLKAIFEDGLNHHDSDGRRSTARQAHGDPVMGDPPDGRHNSHGHRLAPLPAKLLSGLCVIWGLGVPIALAHRVPDWLLHAVGGMTVAAGACIPTLQQAGGQNEAYRTGAYVAWGVTYAIFMAIELYQRRDQRRLMLGLVVFCGANLLGALAEDASTTIDTIKNWGPMALSLSLWVVPEWIQFMGAGNVVDAVA